MSATRLLEQADAPVLTRLLADNRAFLAPWEPVRAEGYFSEAGQYAAVAAALHVHAAGAGLPHVILDEQGRVAGRITLSGIVRGPLLSCSLGYWLAKPATGRGLATAAVREIVGLAFDGLGLHRVQAETLLHNVRSQRVLERSGFTRYGLAPAYLKIAGTWQDHVMFQLLNPHPV